MSFDREDYSIQHLRGNTVVDRNTLAILRSGVRRNDADNTSNVPYYPSASGKTLRIKYTYLDAGDVVETTEDITFSGSGLAAIIDDINAVDPSNLDALDLGGYLGVRNLNSGRTHFIRIEAYSTPEDDAASIFGFVVFPYPGSTSFVNEVSSSPGVRQGNRQGTALIALNEDFKASAFNRAMYALMEQVESGFIDLDAPVIGFKDIAVTFAVQGSSTQVYASLASAGIRVPILGVGGPLRAQSRYFKVLKNTGSTVPGPYFRQNVLTNGSTTPTWDYPSWEQANIIDVCYGIVGSTPFDITGTAFTAWGTPDGKTIYHADVPNKDKQPAVDITTIDGDVVFCETATFVALKVKKGDPVFLEAGTIDPFDHTGWFAVKEVYDETHISIRPMSPSEAVPDDDFIKPKAFNQDGAGTLRVAVGFYIPGDNLYAITQNKVNPGSTTLRVACAVPLREALRQDMVNENEGVLNELLSYLSAHIGDGAFTGHAAEAIRGFNAGTLADTTTMNYAASGLKNLVNDLVGYLASVSSGTQPGGSNKIGAAVINVTRSSPTTYPSNTRALASGRVFTQLQSMLEQHTDHELDRVRHDANGVLGGYGTSGISGLDITVGAGAALAKGMYYSSSSTPLTLTANSTNYIYLDGADGIVKFTTTASDLNDDLIPLWCVVAGASSFTRVSNMTRRFVPNRKRGIITVGSSGCDFLSLEGAIDFLGAYRQVSSGMTAEIVIQGSVTVASTITLTFPVIIRGVATDGSSLVGGPKSRLRSVVGFTMFRCESEEVHNVVFRDLHVFNDTMLSSSFINNTNPGELCGNSWLFDNCWFTGLASGGSSFLLSPEDSPSRSWTWTNCVFKDRAGTGYFVQLGAGCDGYRFIGCTFEGSLANTNTSGVLLNETVSSTMFEDCYFVVGGIPVTINSGADNIRFDKCRFTGARAEAVYFNGSGEVYFDSCTFSYCMGFSTTSRGVIMSDSGAGSIRFTNTRFKDWYTGYAVRATGNTGTSWMFEGCYFSTGQNVNQAITSPGDLLFANNNVDMSPGASAGAGHAVTQAVSVGSGSRVTGNAFRNCGATASASTDITLQLGNGCVVSGNNFTNCRGKLVATASDFNAVFGNVALSTGTTVNDIGFQNDGQDNQEFANRWPGHTSARLIVDPSTFRIHQNYMVPSDPSWAVTGGAGGATQFSDQDGNNRWGRWFAQTTPGVTPGTGSIDYHTITHVTDGQSTNISIAMECYIEAPSGTGLYHQFGLFNSPADLSAATTHSLMVIRPNGSTNWHLISVGSSGTTLVDSGISVVGLHLIRVEYVGADDPQGPMARLWIDGVLCATITTNLANWGDPFYFGCASENVAYTGSTVTTYYSPMTIEINPINK